MATPKLNAAGEKTRARTRHATGARSNTGTAGGAALFEELAALTDKCVAHWKTTGMLG